MSDVSGPKIPGLPPAVLLANTAIQNGLDASRQQTPIDILKSFRDTSVAIMGEAASRFKCAAKFAPVLSKGYNAYSIYEAKQEKNAEIKRAKDTGTLPDQKKLNDCGKKMFINAMDLVSPPAIPVGTIVSTTVEFGTHMAKNPPVFSPQSVAFFEKYGGHL